MRIVFLLLLCAGLASGQTDSAQQANEVQPAVSVLPLSDSTVTDIHLRPLFTTTIRLPEGVTSVAVGAPTLFEVEHSDQEPRLVFVKPSTRETATSNLIIALQSGHEISMRLISDGAEGKTPVDFVINYQPAQSVLIGSSDPMTTGEADSPARKGVPKAIPVIDLALKRQANIATPEWQDARAKNTRNPDVKASGKPLLGALGEVRSQGDEMWVAYSVLNTTDNWIEVLPPQVEINSPNQETAEKKHHKDNRNGRQILAEEVGGDRLPP